MGVFHVVAFNPAPESESSLSSAFLSLPEECTKPSGEKYIISAKGGKQISKEGREYGTKVVFIMEFANKEDLEYYVFHDPAHAVFKSKAKGEWGVNGVVVVDFAEGEF